MRLVALLLLVASWKPEFPVLQPGAKGTFDETAVKDPSVVFNGGQWHVFYTARGHKEYSLGYVAAKRLEDLKDAKRVRLIPAYAAAPQVFFFRPQGLWYLIYQTATSNYQPVYETTKTIGDPKSWSAPRPLVAKSDKGKWIDFWVICDEKQAALFYTRNHQDVVAMTTSVKDFPNGFGNAKTVYSGVHEAVHVYHEKQKYDLLFEVRNDDGSRKFGLAQADKLLGPYRTVPDWTAPASHGELLRTGIDQRLNADLQHARFLIQELPPGKPGEDYAELPWHLSLIKAGPIKNH